MKPSKAKCIKSQKYLHEIGKWFRKLFHVISPPLVPLKMYLIELVKFGW
jgi:hypothetical protein